MSSISRSVGLEVCEQPQQGPDGLQGLSREQVCQPGSRASLVQEDITVLLPLAYTGILGCVCCFQKASPASHLLLLRPLSMEEQQQQLEDYLKQRFLGPTLDFIRTSDCMPKSSVGSLQRALVEPPSLEWVETPQTRERTLHLSPFSTHLPLHCSWELICCLQRTKGT